VDTTGKQERKNQKNVQNAKAEIGTKKSDNMNIYEVR